MRTRFLVDMDGTLAVFTPVDTLETLYEKGYFINLEPHQNVIDAVKHLVKENDDIEVFIMSAVLSDSKYALQEKNEWLDKYLPEIDREHRIFPPCGADKKDYVPDGIRPSDYLLDDYTKNLASWEPPAKGIKLLNGINHTKGTWMSDMVSYDRDGVSLATAIAEIIKGKCIIRDAVPMEKEESVDREFSNGAICPKKRGR